MSNAPTASFATRHIGLRDDDIAHMLSVLKLRDMPALLDEVIPRDILRRSKFDLPAGISEEACLEELSEFASQNQRAKSYIGMGYYGCHVPSVIRRNVLENPAWYTAYTPYQPEISQGRLEAILNFQTMVTELTGMDLANSSLLDEATAAGRLPQKYWPPVGRVDNAYGDRHLICSCPTPEEWAALEQEAQS